MSLVSWSHVASLGPLGADSGLSWGPLVAQLGATLGPTGALLAFSWAFLGQSKYKETLAFVWFRFRGFRIVCQGPLGTVLLLLCPLETNLGRFGGPLVTHLGAMLGPT